MDSEEILQALMSYNQREAVRGLVISLNENGIISDEDNEIKISSLMMENWSEKFSEYIRKNGYNGGELRCIGGYFPAHGAIYVLYDTESVLYEEAKEYLERLGRRKPFG